MYQVISTKQELLCLAQASEKKREKSCSKDQQSSCERGKLCPGK